MPEAALQREPDTRLWYEDKVRRFGYDHRGLGFRTRYSQEKRFEALLGVGDLQGRRVLDVGCGFGDFLAFLLERGIRPVYTGLDICAPMVERCRQRFAGSEATFAVADLLDHEPAGSHDYVVASGIFGLAAAGVRQRIRPSLERMFRWSGVALAVNFLSARAIVKAEGRLYVDPEEAFDWGLALTPAARLDHSYLPNDFTLHLVKRPAWLDTTPGDAP